MRQVITIVYKKKNFKKVQNLHGFTKTSQTIEIYIMYNMYIMHDSLIKTLMINLIMIKSE